MCAKGGLGLQVVFKDVSYVVQPAGDRKQERLTILRSVSAVCAPGQLTAVMGPSGSGKTTLLDVLAGRKTVGETTGTILYGNNKLTTAFLRRHAGYVEQFDTLVDNLTVYEMLMYTAELKRPMSETIQSKRAAVHDLLQKLLLEGCRNVKIGSVLQRGVSGGEAKRVNVGIALVTNPSVLYLDEPTSGLDSFTANEVMQVVKNLVYDGRTICATIHAPSSTTFALFDQVLLLTGGRVMYFGPNHEPLISHFRTLCGAREPKVGDNLSDWIMEFVTTSARDVSSAFKLAQTYQGGALGTFNRQLIDTAIATQSGELQVVVPTVDALPYGVSHHVAILPRSNQLHPAMMISVQAHTWEKGDEYVTSPLWALRVLLQYRTLRNYKALDYLLPRVLDKLVFGISIILLYNGKGSNFGSDNVPNICALMYLCVATPGWGAVAFLPGILLERPLYVRERNDGLYRPIVYLLFKLLDELMIALFFCLMAYAMIFFTVELQGNFGFFYISMVATFANGVAIAYAMGSLCSTIDSANATVPSILAMMLLFSGFLIRVPDMPVYARWITYCNVLRYSWGALMMNQFEEHRNATQGTQPVLPYFALDGYSKWEYLAVTGGFFGAWCILAWVGLTFVRTHRR